MTTISVDVRSRPAPSFASASDELAGRLAERFLRGGRLFVVGDRLSAQLASDLVWLFANPPFGRPLPAYAEDGADLCHVAAEVAASSRPEDIFMLVAADPDSVSIEDAFGTAHRRGLLTVALTDVRLADPIELDCVDCHLGVEPDSDDVMTGLWRRVQMRMAA